MIVYQDIVDAMGATPPPDSGARAAVVLSGVLRCEARSIGEIWNEATVDVRVASSGLATQRNIRVDLRGRSTLFVNVDVSLIIDNTSATTTAAGPEPFATLSKVGAGTPALATGVSFTGGRDARSTELQIGRIARIVNKRMARVGGYEAFLRANPRIARSGDWGALHWGDQGGHDQASWDAHLLSLYRHLSDPTDPSDP